jgi:hypothetical protein
MQFLFYPALLLYQSFDIIFLPVMDYYEHLPHAFDFIY